MGKPTAQQVFDALNNEQSTLNSPHGKSREEVQNYLDRTPERALKRDKDWKSASQIASDIIANGYTV